MESTRDNEKSVTPSSYTEHICNPRSTFSLALLDDESCFKLRLGSVVCIPFLQLLEASVDAVVLIFNCLQAYMIVADKLADIEKQVL